MRNDNYGYVASFFVLSFGLVVALLVYLSAIFTETEIITTCSEKGVYLTQKHVLVCEVHSPYAKR